MGDSSVFTRRLKEARLSCGLSQEQLGVQAGIEEFSASARMNQYERGKHVPHPDTIAKIAEVLRVPVAYFFADEDTLAQFLVLFGKLSEPQKRQLLSEAEALAAASEQALPQLPIKARRSLKKGSDR